jgi:hypothetical protein
MKGIKQFVDDENLKAPQTSPPQQLPFVCLTYRLFYFLLTTVDLPGLPLHPLNA